MRNIFNVFLLLLFSFCGRKNIQENQITIKITLIDKVTRQPRTNFFDTIEIRKEGIGYITKTFDKVGEFVTDASGSIKIKIDSNEGYMFMLNRKGLYGSENYSEAFTKEKLKNGQEVNIEVFTIEN